MKLKVTLLVSAIDRTRRNTDRSYMKILLNDESKVLSKTVSFVGFNDHLQVLRELHSQYINYDFEYTQKLLCNFRTLENNICEVIYVVTVNYIPDFFKAGRVYTLDEIQERGILIEEYYGELFGQFGPTSFR